MPQFTTNTNFQYFMYWVTERQRIFWLRLRGAQYPYTQDPVMQRYKFTNVYRVLDRTSQYLLRRVIYNGHSYSRADTFWRILLFKHFNLINTWEHLTAQLGDITLQTPLEDIIDCLTQHLSCGYKIYNNAYMLTSTFMIGGDPPRKHAAYLHIFKQHLLDNAVYRDILNATSFKEAYDLLLPIPTMGPFIAYQYVQDLNYSRLWGFDDNAFCTVSLGAARGIERVFDVNGAAYEDIARWTCTNFIQLLKDYHHYDQFEPLPGRYPHVPDIINCFCETDKYLRMRNIATAGKKIIRTRMKNYFHPKRDPIHYVFPISWNIKPIK